jgi:crotonobetainyl-CoA:carnitine CoA-transferase CaiB-like acyl-CoA transferase
MLAGPYTSLILADMGAEVIKVEAPKGGDPMRQMAPHFVEGVSAYFLAINRGKKSLALDLRDPRGLELFHELVKVSDVVLDNFRPDVLERLKIDHGTLRGLNPRIISVSISALGQTGPDRLHPAFDLTLQARSGGMSITGEPGRPPCRAGIPIGDLGGGTLAVGALCAALYERERTGVGRRIEISLVDTLVSMLTYVGQYYLVSGEVPEPIGSAHQSVVPYQAFRTADIWIVIAVFTERFWAGLCGVMGHPEWIEDPRFDHHSERRQNREELVGMIQEVFLTRPGDEWLTELEAAGVPCAPVNTVDRVFKDRQVLARNMVITWDHPVLGTQQGIGDPVKTDDPEHFAPPALLGEHTREVLDGLLGLDENALARLFEDGIVGWPDS